MNAKRKSELAKTYGDYDKAALQDTLSRAQTYIANPDNDKPDVVQGARDTVEYITEVLATMPNTEPPKLTPEQAAQIEFQAGVNLAKEGQKLPDGATEAARNGFASVTDKTPLQTLAASAPILTLKEALTQARAALGHALRAIVSAAVPHHKERNALENAYEAAKNECADHKPTFATLKEAAAQLKTAAAILANSSSANKADLNEVRQNAGVIAKHVEALRPPEAKN